MPSVSPVETLLAALRQAQALRPNQLEELEKIAGQFSEPRALGQHLLKTGWLTPFQINQLVRGGDLMLGPYLLLERLGEGHSGPVYKARHLRMNRIVALKAIRKELMSDAAGIERFYQEVEAASKLTHPYVVHAFDAGPMGPTHCLVREYVEGVDLGKLVSEQGPLSVAKACRAIGQAALGLQHAHLHGLQHGGIKPSKLLLTQISDGEGGTWQAVKLLDIGLASLTRSPDGQSLYGQLRDSGATTAYLAPEQLNDGRPVDIRTDIYGLGGAFYYLLTGREPCPTGPAAQELRPDLPPEVAAILSHMLADDPACRYATPAEVAQALTQFAGHDPNEAFGKLLDEPSSIQRRKPVWTRWPVLVGSSALLIVMLGVFYSLMSQGSPERPPTTTTQKLVLLHWLDGTKIPPAERAKASHLVELANVIRHGKGPVRGLAFFSADNLLASAGEDGVVRVWDWKTGNEAAALAGHGRPVLAVAYSADGILASGGRDKRIRIWDGVGLLGEERNLTVDSEWISILLLSPDSKSLLARHKTTELRLWELPAYKAGLILTNNNKKVSAAAIAADSKTLAMASEEKLVRVFDLTKGNKPIHILKGHTKEVTAVAFTPDGKTLLSGSDDLAIKLWDPANGQERGSFSQHTQGINRIAIAADGQRIASAGGDQVLLWRLNDRQVIKDWKLPSPVTDLLFSPNGYLVCACDNGAIYILRLP